MIRIALRYPHCVLICRNTSRLAIRSPLEDSGKTSFSKLKRSFNFEEEEQRNERALTLWVEASDMELATTSGRELCEA